MSQGYINPQTPSDRVLCKDGRVFHACEVCRKRRSRCDGARPQCTPCQRRGLKCEYRAMKKRGRHGKKTTPGPQAQQPMTPQVDSPQQGSCQMQNAVQWCTASTVPMQQTASDALMSIGSQLSTPQGRDMESFSPQVRTSSATPIITPGSSTASIFGNMPRFFSIPPDTSAPPAAAVPQPSAGPLLAANEAAMAAMAAAADAHTVLSTWTSPGLQPSLPLPISRLNSVTAAFTDAVLSPQLLGDAVSSSAPATYSSQSLSAAAVAAAAVRALSPPSGQGAYTNGAFPLPAHSPESSLFGVIQGEGGAGLGSIDAAVAACFPITTASSAQTDGVLPQGTFAQTNGILPQGTFAQTDGVLPQSTFTQTDGVLPQSTFTQTDGVLPQSTFAQTDGVLPQGTFALPASTAPSRSDGQVRHEELHSASTRVTAAEGRAKGRRRSWDWSRTGFEEVEVLDDLEADGADHFGRPMYDVTTYPLPAQGDLAEHLDGMFEYFYMGIQTLHETTFRKRIAAGDVSPMLVYAIMAIASRYSRRPSLYSLNGRAFLNGDRHAAASGGLASVQLNHGDMGTVDTVHAMLFLSVYFMGQGNMLKSRMYLVKAVCTARTMGFQSMDATFRSSDPMISFGGNFDRPQELGEHALPPVCSCPRGVDALVELETRRRIWWFLVFVDYFTANVMNVPLEIPPDSYCVRLPCSDEEWMSATLGLQGADGTAREPDPLNEAAAPGGSIYSSPVPDIASSLGRAPDLAFGDRRASRQQTLEYLRLNGFHDCRPPWAYRAGAFYLERLMIEFCDHLRRLNGLRAVASRSFFQTDPVFIDENYPYLKRKRQFVPWPERLEKVKSSWSWLHLQLNKWLDSILLRFSEVITRVPAVRFNRQYRHQYYHYLIAAHAVIIMSHGVVLQLFTDFSRYLRQQQQQQQMLVLQHIGGACHRSHTPHRDSPVSPMPGASSPASERPLRPLHHGSSSSGLSAFGITGLSSHATPFMSGLALDGGSRTTNSSVPGSPRPTAPTHQFLDDSMLCSDIDTSDASGRQSIAGLAGLFTSMGQPTTPSGACGTGAPGALFNRTASASSIMRDLSDMATIAWEGCVSTAEQLASILRGKHPKFVLLGRPPLDVFHEQVLAGDANILSAPGSAFNAPGVGPGSDNPILSDPDFYMRLQPSTAWWMFIVAQVQVGHIKRLLKESEGCFKVRHRRKRMAADGSGEARLTKTHNKGESAAETASEGRSTGTQGKGVPSDDTDSFDSEVDQLIGMSQRLQSSADKMRPLSQGDHQPKVFDRAAVQVRAAQLVRAYENLSCMVKVLEGMQQYWMCMDYVAEIQVLLKGSEHPLHS